MGDAFRRAEGLEGKEALSVQASNEPQDELKAEGEMTKKHPSSGWDL